MLDNYPSRKRITLRQNFKHWRQLFRKHVGQKWTDEWRKEVNDVREAIRKLTRHLQVEKEINGRLTEEYKLDISTKEKPVMNVDDVYLVQHHHWFLDTSIFPDERQRLQLAFLILLCAYTATRPGALVYVEKNVMVSTRCALGCDKDACDCDDEEEEHIDDDAMEVDGEETNYECLRYKDITLVLLPNPNGERDILAMEVDLRFTKGHKRKFKRYVAYPKH